MTNAGKKGGKTKEYLHKHLGNYLKTKRQQRGLTQKDVASRLGYSTAQFISNFERGLCSPPLNNLKVLVGLYKAPPEEVLEIILKEQENILRRALKQPIKKAARRQ
ncbi:MAG: helix-turn-helix domain-containing protein [Bdellovibrionales bacterium]|nr:helix-turn-helix domain-containing protein [Bdellovibrionales bacterium]